MSLYQHVRHHHHPQNINAVHAAEQSAGNAFSRFNMRVAMTVTKALGSMPCAYLFIALAVYGFPGVHATPTQYVQWVSQTFIQLVALSILQVGANYLSRKAELAGDEQYQTTLKAYHDMEQMIAHLEAQDAELLRQSQLLQSLVTQQGGTHERE